MVVGCNALVGIEQGVPAITGFDSGSGASDGTAPPGDSSTGGDGTMAGGDAGSGGDSSTMAGDSGGDSGPTGAIPVSCAVSSKVMVDDLGAGDGGLGFTFNNQMWIVPSGDGDGVFIVTTGRNQYNSFTLYQASFSGGGFGPTQLGGGNPFGNVRLIDVEPNGTGGESALASYQDDAGMGGLQLVPLPARQGASPPGPPVYITPGFFPSMMVFPNGGAFAPNGNGLDWIVNIKDQNAGTETFYSGGTATDAGPQLLFTTNSNVNGSDPFVAMGNTLYAFVQGLGDSGAGANSSSVLSYPTTFDTPPTSAPVASTAPFSAVIAARPSVASPGDVLVQAANVDFTGGTAQIYAATTPPSGLMSLSIGAPPFTTGATLPITDISFNAGSQVWEGDQLLLAGAGGGNPNDLMFMWIDPKGFASTHGVLLSRPNPIESTAIGANPSPPVVEGFGQFFLAWTERVTDGGQYDQLWVAKVLCTVADH
jgi:hypothetical protein